MVRGLERREIFRDDKDREDLLARLDWILPESQARCFAWVLMSNHIHLVVQTGAVPLSRWMARLNTGYALAFNRRHERSGYLFQGRFRSRMVRGNEDLLNLIRYVHRNPIEAGLVRSLGELVSYPWCGYAAQLGARPRRRFESVDLALELLDPSQVRARHLLREWMGDGDGGRAVDPGERSVGDDRRDPGAESRDSAKRPCASSLEASKRQVCELLGIELADLKGRRRIVRITEARAAVCYLGVTQLGLSCSEVGRELGLSRSAASRALARGRGIARRLGLIA